MPFYRVKLINIKLSLLFYFIFSIVFSLIIAIYRKKVISRRSVLVVTSHVRILPKVTYRSEISQDITRFAIDCTVHKKLMQNLQAISWDLLPKANKPDGYFHHRYTYIGFAN